MSSMRGVGRLAVSNELARSAGRRRTRPLRAAVVSIAAVVIASAPLRADECGPGPYDCALRYIKGHQLAEAVQHLQRLLERSPRDIRALNLLGITLAGQGDIEGAKQKFKKALAIDPRFYPALKNLAINELAQGDATTAESHFNEVLEYAPDDEAAHLWLGEISFQSQRYEKALDHYQKAGRVLGSNSAHLLHYADCLVREGHTKQARVVLISLPASKSEIHFAAGLLLSQIEAYRDAAKQFALARPGYEDPYTAGYNETLSHIRAGDYSQAIYVAEELIAEGNKRAELYSLVADAYVQIGQFQNAYDALRTATQLNPQDEDSYLHLVEICLEKNQYDLAFEITTIGLAHLPSSPRLYVQRGIVEARKGQLAKAEEDFATAAKLTSQDALPYVALGTIRMHQGNVEKAIEALRDGVREDPDDYLAQYMLGRAIFQGGAMPGDQVEKEAVAALESSARLNPDFWGSWAELGKAWLRRGEVDKSIEHLEKALALNPRTVQPAYPLARAYQRKGDMARARELLDHVNKIQEEERESLLELVSKQATARDSEPSGLAKAPPTQ